MIMKYYEAIKILNKIKETSSTKEKGEILKNCNENELLLKILERTYNPLRRYKITTNSLLQATPEKTFESVWNMLDVLESNNINNELKDKVNKFLSYIKQNYGSQIEDLIRNIVLKDLKIGMNVTSINKAIPGLIPEWKVQKGKALPEIKLKKNETFVLELKENGIRATYRNGALISRQGLPHIGFDNIISQIEDCIGKDFVVDGELVRKNVDSIPDNENFRLTTSIVSEENLDNKDQIIFKIFDILPLKEFDEDQFTEKFISDRLPRIQALADKISSYENLSLCEVLYVGSEKDKIDELLEKVSEEGKEGLMLYRDAVYKRDRNSSLIKVKKFKFADLRVVGLLEGKAGKKLEGKFAGFIVEYKGNQVGVGSGYEEKDIEYFTKHGKDYIGRVIEVKYKEESQNKKGEYSLQFPVFVQVREEGKEVSYD